MSADAPVVVEPSLSIRPIGMSKWVDLAPYVEDVKLSPDVWNGNAFTTFTITVPFRPPVRPSCRSRRNARRKEFLNIKRQMRRLGAWHGEFIVLWKDTRRASMRAARRAGQ